MHCDAENNVPDIELAATNSKEAPETVRLQLRDEIKSYGKNSILNQFKIEGGRGSEPRVQFKIAMHQDK